MDNTPVYERNFITGNAPTHKIYNLVYRGLVTNILLEYAMFVYGSAAPIERQDILSNTRALTKRLLGLPIAKHYNRSRMALRSATLLDKAKETVGRMPDDYSTYGTAARLGKIRAYINCGDGQLDMILDLVFFYMLHFIVLEDELEHVGNDESMQICRVPVQEWKKRKALFESLDDFYPLEMHNTRVRESDAPSMEQLARQAAALTTSEAAVQLGSWTFPKLEKIIEYLKAGKPAEDDPLRERVGQWIKRAEQISNAWR